MTRPPKTRNPIAKAVTRLPRKIVPGKRVWDTATCPDCLCLLKECRCEILDDND
jgi:hypothetical protein